MLAYFFEFVQKLAVVFDWALLLAPIAAAESCHAKQCDKRVVLWNDSLVIENPGLAVSIWLGIVFIRTSMDIVFCASKLHKCTVYTIAASITGNYRVYVFLYILMMHTLIEFAKVEICVYSAPLCFTCIEGIAKLLSYCAMDSRCY
jgi:hypothetical protein